MRSWGTRGVVASVLLPVFMPILYRLVIPSILNQAGLYVMFGLSILPGVMIGGVLLRRREDEAGWGAVLGGVLSSLIVTILLAYIISGAWWSWSIPW